MYVLVFPALALDDDPYPPYGYDEGPPVDDFPRFEDPNHRLFLNNGLIPGNETTIAATKHSRFAQPSAMLSVVSDFRE